MGTESNLIVSLETINFLDLKSDDVFWLLAKKPTMIVVLQGSHDVTIIFSSIISAIPMGFL